MGTSPIQLPVRSSTTRLGALRSALSTSTAPSSPMAVHVRFMTLSCCKERGCVPKAIRSVRAPSVPRCAVASSRCSQPSRSSLAVILEKFRLLAVQTPLEGVGACGGTVLDKPWRSDAKMRTSGSICATHGHCHDGRRTRFAGLPVRVVAAARGHQRALSLSVCLF